MNKSKKYFLSCMIGFALVMAGCSNDGQDKDKQAKKKSESVQESNFEIKQAVPQRIERINGLGYPGNDEGLYIASHEGIKIFSAEGWLEGTSEKHEYMGFQASEEGFYASGFPEEEDSDTKAPLGLVKSSDKGASLEKLAFYGESNFPFLSSGYQSDIIYIINQEKNSALEPGVFYSEDEGRSWKPVGLNGFDADTLGMIAAHPTNSSLMAMSTRSGIFMSEDKGEHMKMVTEPVMATALAFSEDALYYSAAKDNKVLFYRMDLKTKESIPLNIPYLNYDNPVTFISVNHREEQTLSFATYLNDVYESTDGGENWNLLLKNGKIE
ncbi:F510_1955 family glycosylhydrolase [Cytobacillus sp. FJAT-53684]|uniref:F510_1955 family glycosylhydrolase n=1 Tax=Cytobacillus mangrovibacter TaxID=3299024 RepID=A0ABW6K0A9_9BACI